MAARFTIDCTTSHLQHAHRFCMPSSTGPITSARHVLEHLVGDVRGVEVGEDEDVAFS